MIALNKSRLESQFESLWQEHGPIGLDLTPEHRFAPGRRLRFDYAHLPSKTAIEIEGLVWFGKGGRHQRAERLAERS